MRSLQPRPRACDWIAGLATATLLVADQLLERGDEAALHVLGVAALLLSIAFIFPPFFLLKKHGQVEEGKSYFETRAVVDRGLYGIVRHPQYLGYILLALGFASLSQRIVTAALAALAIVMFYVHTLREERFCAAELGPAYEAYMGRVPRFNFLSGLVKYVWRRFKS
jgi:protein-S-isoprenylcysteine O-methyltransferase Ste14